MDRINDGRPPSHPVPLAPTHDHCHRCQSAGNPSAQRWRAGVQQCGVVSLRSRALCHRNRCRRPVPRMGLPSPESALRGATRSEYGHQCSRGSESAVHSRRGVRAPTGINQALVVCFDLRTVVIMTVLCTEFRVCLRCSKLQP